MRISLMMAVLLVLTGCPGSRDVGDAPAPPPELPPAVLAFHEVSDEPTEGFSELVPAGSKEGVWVSDQPLVANVEVVSAEATQREGIPHIDVVLGTGDARRFAEVTETLVGRRLAIVLDGKLLSAPTVQTAIVGGRCQIIGDFTTEQARDIAAGLEAAARESAK